MLRQMYPQSELGLLCQLYYYLYQLFHIRDIAILQLM